MEWDEDIAALAIDDFERNGLQVFRNYERAFTEGAIRRFVAQIDIEDETFEHACRVCDLLSSEEPLVLPMIACAFADDALKAMFKRVVPEAVPGGRAALFSGFGPLGSLSSRTKMAFAFDLVSRPVLLEVERLRAVRNRVAHGWDHAKLGDLFGSSPLKDLHAIERDMIGSWFPEPRIDALDAVARFRIRAVWIAARLAYETMYWARAKEARLDPGAALYGPDRPKALAALATLARHVTEQIVHRQRAHD